MHSHCLKNEEYPKIERFQPLLIDTYKSIKGSNRESSLLILTIIVRTWADLSYNHCFLLSLWHNFFPKSRSNQSNLLFHNPITAKQINFKYSKMLSIYAPNYTLYFFFDWQCKLNNHFYQIFHYRVYVMHIAHIFLLTFLIIFIYLKKNNIKFLVREEKILLLTIQSLNQMWV